MKDGESMLKDFDVISIKESSDIILYPLADLHVGDLKTDYKRWLSFRDAISKQENARIIIGGDLANNALKSSVSNSYEDTMRPSEQKRWLAEELKPVKHQIIAAVGGNHEARSAKDADDLFLYDVLTKLDIENIYRENAAFVYLTMPGDRACKQFTYTIADLHGSGGGSLTGSGVNKNERFSYYFDNLDIQITGHTHKPSITYPGRIILDTKAKSIRQSITYCLTCSAWQEYGGYALNKMLQPSSIVGQMIYLSSKQKRVKITSGDIEYGGR